jgi:hypothetical protein
LRDLSGHTTIVGAEPKGWGFGNGNFLTRLGSQGSRKEAPLKGFTASAAVVACAALGFVGLAVPASAPAGAKNANVKACQRGGWEHLSREDGSTFAHQGECASYAARGGTILFQLPACFDSSKPSYTDVELVAPIDTQDNAKQYISEDGTCSGQVILGGFTIVEAEYQSMADTKCATIEGAGSFAVGNLQKSFGFATAPSDWWPCHAV